MADFSGGKPNPASIFPGNAVDSDNFGRYEPLITPDQLITRFLFGINLEAAFANQITQRKDRVTNDILQDFIIRAVNKLEAEMKISIFPTQFSERVAFDKVTFQQFGYIRTRHKPIVDVESIVVMLPNGSQIFNLDTSWIETGGFLKGRINIVPFNTTTAGTSSTGGGGMMFLSLMGGGQSWIPALITVNYTCGFKDGKVPTVINDIIGATAAMDILGMLATNFINNSYSLSLDGLSQSSSNAGPGVYNNRIEGLANQRKELMGHLRMLLGSKMVFGQL